jgi:hypothetical protein
VGISGSTTASTYLAVRNSSLEFARSCLRACSGSVTRGMRTHARTETLAADSRCSIWIAVSAATAFQWLSMAQRVAAMSRSDDARSVMTWCTCAHHLA